MTPSATTSTSTSGSPATLAGRSTPPDRDRVTGEPRGSGFGGRRRYHEVDILRLIAALGVVGFHFMFRATAADVDPVLARTGFSDPGGVFHYGNIGVPLFFVISGFVILNSAWHRSPITFLSSRVGRLYPAFWAACTLTTLVMALSPDDRFGASFTQWLGNLSMFSEAYGVGYVDGVYWTLTIELAFYLLVLAFIKVGLTTDRVIAFCVGWLGICVLDAAVRAPDWMNLILVPSWACYFVAGMLFALIARDRWRWKYVLPLAASYACCLWWGLDYFNYLSGYFHVTYSPVVIALAITAIFAIFAAISSGFRLPGARKLAVAAGLTYPLYLIHENIGFITIDTLHGALGVNRWVTLAVTLALVIGVAWILHVAVENRFSRPLAALLTRTWETVRDALRTRMPVLLRDW